MIPPTGSVGFSGLFFYGLDNTPLKTLCSDSDCIRQQKATYELDALRNYLKQFVPLTLLNI